MAGRNGAPTMPDESTARVALATCAQVPDLDRDTKTLLFVGENRNRRPRQYGATAASTGASTT